MVCGWRQLRVGRLVTPSRNHCTLSCRSATAFCWICVSPGASVPDMRLGGWEPQCSSVTRVPDAGGVGFGSCVTMLQPGRAFASRAPTGSVAGV